MNKLYLLVAVGLLIRLVLSPILGFKIDINAWSAWAFRGYELGFPNFYSDIIWTNYTPGYIYILYILEAVKRFFNLSPEMFYILLKIPSILAELTLASFVFKIIKERFSINIAIIAASLVLLNPAFIFNSSVWGQIDGLLTLLMILSVYHLTKSRLILSSIFFTLALLIKPQALFLMPVYILFILKNFNLDTFLKLVIPGAFLALTASLPFFPNKPLTGLIELVIKMANDYPASSLFAYNFWGIIGFWIDDSNNWYNLSYREWGILLLACYWISLILFYFKKTINLYALCTLALLSFYFLPTRVHERYLYPAIVFLILFAASLKSRTLFLLANIISFIHLLNLYYAYVYYNEFYLKMPKLLYNPILYNLLDTQSRSLSFLSTTIFVLISLVIIRLNYGHSKT